MFYVEIAESERRLSNMPPFVYVFTMAQTPVALLEVGGPGGRPFCITY